ncbi:MAG: CHC2 zinc finger domain-containing protein [Candidatus Dormibacter sp.]
MARVPEAELERIKAEVSLERLAEAKGVELKRHGADLLGLCPFHDDHEPSLVISPKKNLWHCLGACQAGGSVIDWVMRAEGMSFRHAVELLRTDPSLAATPGVRNAKDNNVRKLPAPVAMDSDDQEVLRQVVDYYRATLRESPEAMAYLESRGLADRDAIDHFQLGFANRTLGLRLPEKNRKSGAEMRTRLQRLGIMRDSGHEHFNGSLVMPIADGAGDIVEMYGRKIGTALRAGTPLHMYLPGPHRGVWNGGEIAAAKEVILCEALLDALTFYVNGMRNVTSAYGIEGFTDEHLAVFTTNNVQRVYIAYDRDAAGDKAAVQIATKLVAAGIDTFRIQFPKDMDANAFACLELSTAAERLAEVVRRAVWLGQGNRPTIALDAAVQIEPDAHEDSGQGEGASAEPTPSPEPATPTDPTPPPFAAESPTSQATLAPRVEITDDDVTMTLGDRRWRVRGLANVSKDDSMKVNLLLRAGDDRFHVDTLDVYVSKQRQAFANQAAAETGVLEETVRRDLGRVLLQLETLIAERRQREQEAIQAQSGEATLSDEDRAAALTVLRDPALLEHVVAAYDRIGVVGEANNKLVAYLAATSRLLERPLAVVMQSSSAAGKSALLEATLALLPESARVKYSAMTGQSLYYMAERELAHKVLAVVEEEGAERAAYALKLLQSEGELSIASTGKDPQTGRLVTHDYTVRGPVALFLTTTAIDVDEELLNRCLVLSVDEERGQTEAIHRRQRERETLSGLLREQESQATIRLHRAAQTLLRSLHVVNPFAPQLTFASTRTRTRRDHQKYLALIRTVALLHQHQRETKRATTDAGEVEYIEVIPADIAVANRLAHEVLGRSLDELPPQTRRLLLLLDEMVRGDMERHEVTREEVRFSRKEIRDQTGWGDTQLKVHLHRLTELEYLTTHLGGRRQPFLYELTWDGAGADGTPRLTGLLDPEALTYDSEWAGQNGKRAGTDAEWAGSGRGVAGVRAGSGRIGETSTNGNGHKGFPLTLAAQPKNAVPGSEKNGASPVVPNVLAAAN